ncbi:MAG: urease subunit gamma [Verrucomicrobia bacterium]|nr:urease subunit gamma [Verrucomicrobiota bacterium]
MRLSPKEIDKLMLHQAGVLAQKRYARGLRLNYTESVALIASQLLEFIRDGERVSVLMNKGKGILGYADVMPGVAGMIQEVQVEGTFPDGSKLVAVQQPICRENGDDVLALYGSGLVRHRVAPDPDNSSAEHPGECLSAEGSLVLNKHREAITLTVLNTGDRPIQVGSHYPLFEANAALLLDREKAYGCRLDIPAGTAIRFEPGESRCVQVIAISGDGFTYGGNGLTNGSTAPETLAAAMDRMTQQGFQHQKESRGGAK